MPTKKQKKKQNTNKNNKRQNKAIKINPLKIGGPDGQGQKKSWYNTTSIPDSNGPDGQVCLENDSLEDGTITNSENKSWSVDCQP